MAIAVVSWPAPIVLQDIGFPCVVKPIMSSSGKGQSVLRGEGDLDKAWEYAQAWKHRGTCPAAWLPRSSCMYIMFCCVQEGGRAGKGKVIVEGFIDFDYEITLLTVRHVGGTSFCEPIGHRQAC
jgi:phosphoribosylglycinamide formyltransferase 2